MALPLEPGKSKLTYTVGEGDFSVSLFLSPHKDIFVLDVFEDEQDVPEFGLDLVRAEFLAEGRFPQQHITVVGQELGALGLGGSLAVQAGRPVGQLQPEN